MIEIGWAIVYNVSQKLVSLFYTMHPIIMNSDWAIVYNVSWNLVSLLCTLSLIIAKFSLAI